MTFSQWIAAIAIEPLTFFALGAALGSVGTFAVMMWWLTKECIL